MREYKYTCTFHAHFKLGRLVLVIAHPHSDSHGGPDKSLLGVVFGGQNSGIEKAFLFDVVSKIYIATDSSPVDMQTYELCCDMIDVVIDISCIYG